MDREAGVLYVASAGAEAIEAFDAEGGAFLAATPLGFSPRGVAVDNDPASLTQGEVYVYDATHNRVARLHPGGGGKLEEVKAFAEGGFASRATLDVAPGGVLYVADAIGGDRRVQRFDPEGTPIPSPPACEALAPGDFGPNLEGFAVDSAGGFYLASGGGVPIRRYGSGCAWLEEEDFHASFNIQTTALGEGGELYVADSTDGATAIYAYDATGALTRVLYGGGTLERRALALAPYALPNGDMFAVESPLGQNRVVHLDFEPPGPVVDPNPALSNADPISATKATLNADVNPEGKASEFRLQYVEEAAYLEDLGEGGDGFDGAQSTATAPVPSAEKPTFVEELFRQATVSAQIGCSEPEDPPQAACLTPQTAYRFRVLTSNADGKAEGPVGSFETRPPLEIGDQWASAVGTDAAKLSAQATAFGIPLSGHFQYVAEAICLQDVEAAEAEGAEDPAGRCFDSAAQTPTIDFGSAEGEATRTVQLRSLAQGTAYRYRIVAENLYGERAGSPHAFATHALATPGACPNDALRGGGAAKLPDCRAYEMVSPVDKEGGEIRVAGAFTGPAEANQAAAEVPTEGAGLTYSSVRAFADAISAPYTSQYLATRHPLGSADEGWQSHGISPRREGAILLSGAAGGLDTQYTAFSEDLGLGWLRTDSEPPLSEDAIAGYANLYRRENADDSYAAICPVQPPQTPFGTYVPVLQGSSADGTRAVFRANDKLVATAASGAAFQLYGCEIDAAEPVVVSVLPGGAASGGNSSAGTAPISSNFRTFSLHNAVSTDGERVYWTDSGSSGFGNGPIYLREHPFAAGAECAGSEAPCTVAVSAAVGGEGAGAAAQFWTAAPDGSVAIFSFTAGPLQGNLYEFDAATESASLIAEATEGVAGYSEDARRVFFTSTQSLVEGAVAGQRNIYLHEVGEEPRLVAAAVAGAGSLAEVCSLDGRWPVFLSSVRCAHASPDGSRLAFVSRAALTGYDNTDLASGEAAAEVFLYDAEAEGGEGELLCVSCNPSGARPVSRVLVRGSSQTPTAARLAAWQDSFYAPRALSADGERLFFESFDDLLAADTNGAADVYQWQRAGKGSCEEGDANYFAQNGGCIDLISTGEDRHDSQFLDASAEGSDVFFKTAESLWDPDPGLVDIYDARIEGGFPAPAAPRLPCEGEACQSPPAPPSQADPASSLFAGPGNLAQRPRCGTLARRAKRLAGRAKRLRRSARRAKAPARRRALRRRARAAAKRAHRDSRSAKRCRARARATRRAGR